MNRLAIPVGIFRIDRHGIVQCHVSVVDGVRARSSTVGRNFYEDIAPCTNCPNFRGRVDRLLRDKGGSLHFGFRLREPWRTAQIDVRIFSSDADHAWILLTCPELVTDIPAVLTPDAESRV